MTLLLHALILGLVESVTEFLPISSIWGFNPVVVASASVIGGVLILWAERRKHVIRAETVDDLNWRCG